MNIEQMLENGMLRKEVCTKEMIDKELDQSELDLQTAKESFEEGKYKWSIVQAYYSIFHISRAMLFKKGYREKSHFAVYLFLDYLCILQELDQKYVAFFKAAMHAREDADYDAIFSEDVSKNIIDLAIEFQKLKHKI